MPVVEAVDALREVPDAVGVRGGIDEGSGDLPR
jgi:hypothetical protein